MSKRSHLSEVRPEPSPESRERQFQNCYENYGSLVLGFFARRGFGEEECRDLTQETFFRVYKNLRGLRSEQAEKQWLFTVAANVYRNELRHRGAEKRTARLVSLDEGENSSRTARGSGVAPSGAAGRGPLDDAILAENRRLLREALAGLPPRMRRCTLMRLGQDLTYQQIAELLHISPSTVKVQLHQARKRLIAALGQDLAELGP